MTPTAAQVAYLKWLAHRHPALYRRATSNVPTDITLGSLGWINFVVQAIATVGSAVIAKKQVDKQVSLQKKALQLSDAQAAADRQQAGALALLEVNTKRAQAGQPPVDINGNVINTARLPTPSALAPYTGGGSSAGTIIPGVPNIVTYLGGALLGFGLLRAAKVL